MSRSERAINFYSKAEQFEIIDTIKAWEDEISGEIKVHVENSCETDPVDRAKELFMKLKLHKTQNENGVLIYMAVKDHKFAVIGDKGLNDKVDKGFWKSVAWIIKDHFKNDLFLVGVKEAIKIVANELKIHFPYQEGDTNEISDDISFG